MDDSVIIVDYDPQWPQMYEEERARILAAIGDYVDDIQHVGSTAIPGMAAKPIIDMVIIVSSLVVVEHCVTPLEQLGYTYMGENGIPARHFFVKWADGRRVAHIHMMQADHIEVNREMLFRDYLRQNAQDAQEYAELKKSLAAQYRDDRGSYTDGKASFVEAILVKASLDDA